MEGRQEGRKEGCKIIFRGRMVEGINCHSRKLRKKGSQTHRNLPKMEVWVSLGAILDPFDEHLGHMLPKGWNLGRLEVPWEPKMANLASTCRPKTFQNRCKNAQKSLSKNYIYLASFFGGLGPHFGRIFGGFCKGKYEQIIKVCFWRKP